MIEISRAKNGELTLTVTESGKTRLLHSAWDPSSEASRLIESYELTAGSIPLVIGLGLGYHVEALLDRESAFPAIYVFEARPDVFAKAKESGRLARILAHPKVRLVVESDHLKLMSALYQVASSPQLAPALRLIVHQPSLALYQSGASDLTDIIEKVRVAPKFQSMLRENFIANLPDIIRSPGVKELFGALKKKPLFLVSAGPSLKRDLAALSRVKESGVVLCASTVFTLLLENGIRPDYVAIGDPKSVMATHFKGATGSDVPLIFLATASKAAVLAYKGPKIVALQHQYLFSDLVSERLDKGRVEVGESVATMMLDIAIKSGADPIVFVGQDLAFTDGHTHAEGISKRLRIDTGSRTVKSISGADLPTSSVLYWMLHWIEKRIQREKAITFINASQTGAEIKGTVAMPLDETVSRYCIKSKPRARIRKNSPARNKKIR